MTTDDTHVREVTIPSIPFGPERGDLASIDASYYREAAYNIRWHAERGSARFAGSNLTETVARLCEAAAEALADGEQRYRHDDTDCHGTRCRDCGCCMHSKSCAAECCHNDDCGCSI